MTAQDAHWLRSKGTLMLKTHGENRVVPPVVAAKLMTTALSADADEDCARLDNDLALLDQRLRAELVVIENALAAAQAHPQLSERVGWLSRLRRRAVDRDLPQEVLTQHHVCVTTLAETEALRSRLRSFVIDLRAERGLFAELASGWARSPSIPATVIEFADEDAFLRVDPRRHTQTALGDLPVITATLHGSCWRRDGDEDLDTDPIRRAGPWEIGHIAATDEVYAVRRSEHFSAAVWLLGRNIDGRSVARRVATIEHRMREPNSLLLAVETLRGARHDDADITMEPS